MSNQPVVETAIAWLKASQEPDGHWDAARWGAQANYTPGITALALLALMSRGPGALEDDGAKAVDRGIEYLLGQQNTEGRIGRLCSGTPYNQGLATLAILRAARYRAEPRWLQAADRALAYIRATQLGSGGWGYPRAAGDNGNTSITVWQLQALLEAEAAGKPELRPHIDRGMAWLEGMMDAEGRIGYSRPGDFPHGHLTLTAAAALCLLRNPGADARSERLARIIRALQRDAALSISVDYYRYYFLTQALRAAGEDTAGAILSRLRTALLACQVREGANAGSFEASDPWSTAGGRVYATAMAVLAM